MGNERGLPSLPRGLSRDLTLYLQSLAEFVLRLSGAIRGTEDARAVRAVEKGTLATGTAVIGQGAVGNSMLKPGSVTTDKLADGAVTGSKLAQSSVTNRSIRPGAVETASLASGAVTESCLADGAVTADKLAQNLLPRMAAGSAKNGDCVMLPGKWKEAPCVAMTALHMVDEPQPAPDEPVVNDPQPVAPTTFGVVNLRQLENKEWVFDAAGDFDWVAIGYEEGA